MMLVSLMIIAMSVLEPVAHAQVSGDWIPSGSLNTPRNNHTATLLPSGKVLVVAGYNGTDLLSVELYDPATETWSFTGSLNTPRNGHTATLLANGKVLVAGGYNGSFLNSAELYDPATGTWSVTGSLHTARSVHTATLLQNGKVLVTGGHIQTPNFGVTNSGELYDPTTGMWTITSSLNTPRVDHTATLLQNGKVLVAGGTLLVNEGSYLSVSAVATAELYDPAAETWSNTGHQNSARFYHTATLLDNGKVLVAGGSYPGPPIGPAPPGAYKLVGLNSAELYDPGTGRWTYTGELNTPHAFHTATLLQNDRVLVVAGTDSISNYPTDHVVTGVVELYDVATESWSMPGNLNTAREFHTATLLQNGQVLVAGGDDAGSLLNSTELYHDGDGSLQPTPLTLAPPVLPDAEIGVEYGARLVFGGLPPYTINLVKGVLPPGLSDTPTSGSLSGTSTSTRSRSFTVQITDDFGSSVTGTFTLKLLRALENHSSALKTGTYGRPYKTTLKAAGGKKPYSWSLVSGNLPAGLSLDGLTDVIYGIPTETGTFDLTFHVADPVGGMAATVLTLTIK